MVLLPEFAAAARTALAASGDLVLMLPTTHEVDIIRRQDERLLDRLIPIARGVAAKADEPVCDQPVLLSHEGLALFSYVPATQPATHPATAPATRPQYHIVD